MSTVKVSPSSMAKGSQKRGSLWWRGKRGHSMCDGIITTVPSFIQLTYQVERCLSFPGFVKLFFKLVDVTFAEC